MNRLFQFGMALVLCSAMALAQNAGSVPEQILAYPGTILYNGKIFTMDDTRINTSVGTIAEAMAVRDGKVLALGKTDDILRYAGPRTQKIDLKGRTVLPGIINSHIHGYGSGDFFKKNPEVVAEYIQHVSVSGKTVAELRQGIETVLKQEIPTLKPGQWLNIALPQGGAGTGIGIAFIQTGGMTRQMLDRLAPNTPVVLSAKFSLINSAAAKAAEAENGFPLATLRADGFVEASVGPNLEDRYFSTHLDELTKIQEQTLLNRAAAGMTTWASRVMLQPAAWNGLRKLARDGRLPNRFAFSIARSDRDIPDPASFFKALPDTDNDGNDYMWMMGVGTQSLDSGPPGICTTMEAPKAVKDREICRILPGNAYAAAVYGSIRAGHRLALGHVYGDKALDYFFDELERAMKDDPSITLDYIRSRNFSSDHCGFYPRAVQIPVLAKYNMILSCSPRFLDRSAPWLKDYGNFYANRIVPLKSLLAGGVKVAFEEESGHGQSYFANVPYIMTRKNFKGDVIAPEEAVDRVSIMKMMTSWASEFVGRPKVLGTLEAGKWADYVVLNKDYFTAPVEEIPTIIPLMTVLGGKIVVLRAEFARELGMQPVGPQVNFDFRPQSNYFPEE